MKGNNEAFTVARYSPGIYKTEAVMFLKQCLDSDTFAKLSRSENFRRNPVVAAKIYLRDEDWNKYVWIEQHGSLDGFTGENVPDTGQRKQNAKIINIFEEETKMKNELEKYIGELSPELQEKARECKTMDELNTLLAENDVELSVDALQAVAGGCGSTRGYKCIVPGCGGNPLQRIRSEANYEGWVLATFFRCPKCGRMHYTGQNPWEAARVYGPFLVK